MSGSTSAKQQILDETRTITFTLESDATVCDMVSVKTASYGDLSYLRTKHGSIGIGVEQRLLPELGGLVLADGGRQGRTDIVHEQESVYVA